MGVGNYDACLDGMNLPDGNLCGFAGTTCINDGGAPAVVSVCSDQGCANAAACPAAPATSTAPVTCAGAANDGYLDCGLAQTCPTGMDCFAGFVCLWPVP